MLAIWLECAGAGVQPGSSRMKSRQLIERSCVLLKNHRVRLIISSCSLGVTPMPCVNAEARGEVQLVMVAEACLATWPGPDDRCVTSHAPAVAAPARPSSPAARMRSWASGEADSRSVSPSSATLSTPVEAAPKATRRGAAPAEFGLIQ